MVTFGVKWTLVDHPDHATARYYMLDSIPLDRPVRALLSQSLIVDKQADVGQQQQSAVIFV